MTLDERRGAYLVAREALLVAREAKDAAENEMDKWARSLGDSGETDAIVAFYEAAEACAVAAYECRKAYAAYSSMAKRELV
jgi:hypothetical protein